MHGEAYEYVAAHRYDIEPVRRVLEIGSRDVNGSVRGLFAGTQYVGVDIAPGDGVDVVADGSKFRPKYKVDVVVCCEVLEHTRKAKAIVANAGVALRKGGMFVATMAGPNREPHSAVDGNALRDGEFYRNVSARTLHGWLLAAGFTKWDIDEQKLPSDVRCVAIR